MSARTQRGKGAKAPGPSPAERAPYEEEGEEEGAREGEEETDEDAAEASPEELTGRSQHSASSSRADDAPSAKPQGGPRRRERLEPGADELGTRILDDATQNDPLEDGREEEKAPAEEAAIHPEPDVEPGAEEIPGPEPGEEELEREAEPEPENEELDARPRKGR